MEKHYSSKAKTTEKSTPEEKSENITENSSIACSLTSELNPQYVEQQSSIPQLSSPATFFYIRSYYNTRVNYYT